MALALICAACSSEDSAGDIAAGPQDVEPVFETENSSEIILPSVPFAAVVGDEPRAVLVARDILAKGGTAADAAVGLYFMMAVTFPSTSSLGGGGACLVNNPGAGAVESLDFTARTPSFVSPDADRPSGVPGSVRGMFALHSRFGVVDWDLLLQPAEKLARVGSPVSRALARDLSLVSDGLLADPAARGIFADADGVPLSEGDKLEQLDLAALLTRLRLRGAGDFYEGQLATQLVAAAEAAGGTLSRTDLSAYQVEWQPAVAFAIDNRVVYTAQPPAAGGLTTIQILSMLMQGDRFDDASLGAQSHLFVEASMRAFADRGQWLGPMGGLQEPVSEILDRARIDGMLRDFDPERHTDPDSLTPPPRARAENPAAASFITVDSSGWRSRAW